MKKSLLILSMLALTAASARAYDTLEPGTADAPNYYLIKAVSDNSFITYSEEGITAGSSTTNLTRVSEPDVNSVWGVTPGSTDGSYTIKLYNEDHYLMLFQDAEGAESNVSGGYANVSSSAVDIYPGSFDNGQYSLRIRNKDYDYAGGTSPIYGYTLYAPAGASTFGCTWNTGNRSVVAFKVYKLQIDDATTVEQAIADKKSQIESIDALDDARVAALATLNAYIVNVPIVAEALTPYVAQVNAATSVDAVNTLLSEAETAGNAVLSNGLNGNVYALKNLRHEANNRDAYPALNEASNSYTQYADMNTNAAWFKFNYSGGGYYLTNMADNKNVDMTNEGIAPATANTAIFVYPVLCSSGNLYGVSFPFSADHTGNGFNMNNESSDSKLVSYGYADAGSIWAIVNVWDTYAQPTIDELNNYAATTVPVDEYFTQGVEAINAIGYTSDLVTKPAEILTNAITEANAAIKTALDGKTFSVKNERNGQYLYPNGSQFNVTANNTAANTWFKFVSDPDHTGGYTMQNIGDELYVSTELSPSADSKLTVYPMINHCGKYYGISFCNAENSTGIDCFNYNGKLLYWNKNDEGALWSMSSIDDAVKQPVTNELAKYVGNVGPVADIFTKAIDDINAMEVTSTVVADVNDASAQAIADANEALKTALVEKSVSLKSLRNGYVCAGEDGFTISSEQSDLANYDFAAADGGGYTVYSPVVQKYIGPGSIQGQQRVINFVEEKADAQVVYPVIYHNGNYYGVALPMSDSDAGATSGLNTNANGLFGYQIADDGSIFAIKVMGNSTEITEISAAPAAQGIYDLSGRKLSAPVRGINIINGRKVLVK